MNTRHPRRWILGSVFCALAFCLPVLSAGEGGPGDTTGAPGSAPKGESARKLPRVAVAVCVDSEDGRRTELGTLVIELYPEDAPRHVENFLKLVKEGYYTGLTFHRIVPALVIQGGDPQSRSNWQSNRLGVGGPDYTLPAEIGRKHVRGAVAAARKDSKINPQRESSGSQFYICLADLPSLDQGGYSVFGQVVDGMEVVDKIARVKNSGPPQNQALQRVQMTSVRVLE